MGAGSPVRLSPVFLSFFQQSDEACSAQPTCVRARESPPGVLIGVPVLPGSARRICTKARVRQTAFPWTKNFGIAWV